MAGAGGRWRGVEPGEVVATLRSRWEKGQPLRDHAAGVPWQAVSVPLRPPTARQLGEQLEAVTAWAQKWKRARGFRVETGSVGGRLIGANELPVRAWVDDAAGLWALIGVAEEVARFEQLRELVRERRPELEPWVAENPATGVRLWPVRVQLLDVLDWMVAHAGPGTYLRQIDVPGGDTKFVERYRSELGELLDVVLAPERVDAAFPRSRFVERYRLARKPSYVRLRRLDGTSLLPGGGPAEIGLRVADLAASPIAGERFVVVENETTYLALPAVEGAVAVLGEGYAVTRLAPVGWLRERELAYWGDLDTHGLVMLDRMRGHFGHLRSLLMDEATLLAHEPHWDAEPTQSREVPQNLTGPESALYRDLLENRFGPGVRLEQERIRFSAVRRALTLRELFVD